jgi:hypothetical protein
MVTENDYKSALRLIEGNVWGSDNTPAATDGLSVGRFMPFGEEVEFSKFPLEYLPHVFQDAIKNFCGSAGASVDMAAVLALSVLGAVFQKRYYTQLPTHTEPLNIYTCVSMPPSAKKTPVISFLSKPIMDFQKAKVEEESSDITARLRAKSALESKAQALTTRLSKATLDEQPGIEAELREVDKALEELLKERLVPRKLIIGGNTTPEALAEIMEEQGEGVSMFSDEAKIFKMLCGMYSKVTDTELIKQAFSGSYYDSNRKNGKKGTVLYHPCLTMCICTQPGILAGITKNEELVNDGTLARFLYASPKIEAPVHQNERPAFQQVYIDAYNDSIRRALEFEDSGAIIPSDEALETGKNFTYAFEAEAFGEYANIGGWMGKLSSQMWRIAAGLFAMDCCDRGESPTKTRMPKSYVEMASGICLWLRAHTLHVFCGKVADPLEENAKYVMGKISLFKGRNPTKRDILRAARRFQTIGDLDVPIAELVRRGYISVSEQKHTNGKFLTKINVLHTLDEKE